MPSGVPTPMQSQAQGQQTTTTVAAPSVSELGAQAFLPDATQALSTQTWHPSMTPSRSSPPGPTCAYLDAMPDSFNQQQKAQTEALRKYAEVLPYSSECTSGRLTYCRRSWTSCLYKPLRHQMIILSPVNVKNNKCLRNLLNKPLLKNNNHRNRAMRTWK